MTHTLSCVSAFAFWQFLDQLVTTFLEPVQVKERSLANREGVGGLSEPEPEPGPMMWSGHCAPRLAGPANPGQTGQGTYRRRLGELLGPLQGGAGWIVCSHCCHGGVLCEVEEAREGKTAECW